MKIRPFLAAAAALVCVTAGCASSPGSSDAWSRSYLAPKDNVFDAVVDVLEDEGYLVEPDRSSYRVTADPSRGGQGSSPSWFITVAEKSGRIRVDIQTRAGATGAANQSARVDAAIAEFFHELELRLQGLKD